MIARESSAWTEIGRLHAEGELRFAVAGTLGNWIAAFGERIGVPALAFNRLRFADWHHRSLETAPVAVEGLLALYPTMRTAIDLGCGTGVYVNEMRQRGLRAVGYERSRHARRRAKRAFALDLRPFDISRFDAGGMTYDICLCLEVAHYLTPSMAERLVLHCAQTAARVAFSSPRKCKAGAISNREHWIERFAAHRMRFCAAETAILERQLRAHLTRNLWLAENISLFIRRESDDW
jgi:SAM-dependent methyltransferase